MRRERTAVHEAGHAVVAVALGVEIVSVTLAPHPSLGGDEGGAVIRSRACWSGRTGPESWGSAEDEVVTLVAGHVSLELVLGRPLDPAEAGSSDDLARARRLSTCLVLELLERLGLQADGVEREQLVRAGLDHARHRAEAILREHRSALDRVVEHLLATSELKGEELEELMPRASVIQS